MKQKHIRHYHGFTLIELMVVIVILGILTLIGINAFMSSQLKARDSRRKSDFGAISRALEMYYNDKSAYPAHDPGGSGNIMGCGTSAINACTWGSNTMQFKDETKGTLYMAKLPGDPVAGQRYMYQRYGTGSGYYLYARLENTQDADIPRNGDTAQAYSVVCVPSGSKTKCNYAAVSSNLAPPTAGDDN